MKSQISKKLLNYSKLLKIRKFTSSIWRNKEKNKEVARFQWEREIKETRMWGKKGGKYKIKRGQRSAIERNITGNPAGRASGKLVEWYREKKGNEAKVAEEKRNYGTVIAQITLNGYFPSFRAVSLLKDNTLCSLSSLYSCYQKVNENLLFS